MLVKKNITINHSSLNSVPTSNFLITIISLNCVSSLSYLFFSLWCLLLLYFSPLPSWRLKVDRKKTVSVVLFVLHFRFLISYDIFFPHILPASAISLFLTSLYQTAQGLRLQRKFFAVSCDHFWLMQVPRGTVIVE